MNWKLVVVVAVAVAVVIKDHSWKASSLLFFRPFDR